MSRHADFMLKKTSILDRSIDEPQAIGIGVKAVELLASDPELLDRFLGLSGLSVEQLRREAQRPAFFAGLLDFFLEHEPTLERFAAAADISVEQIVAARATLANSFGAPVR